ncbi:hypothetical protein [Brevibacterium sediminis]
MDPQLRQPSDNDKGGPYAISLTAGALLSLVYFGIRQVHLQFFPCGEYDEACNDFSDLFFGWNGIFLGYLVVFGWAATSLIAPSVLNQLRPQSSLWVRGLMSAGFCVLVTFLIIVVFGGMWTFLP